MAWGEVEGGGDGGAEGGDGAGEFVAADSGEGGPHGARGEDGVGVAVGCGEDADEDLLACWGGRFGVVDFEDVGGVEFLEDLSTHCCE